MMALDSGSTKVKKKRVLEQPSMLAASRSSSGMVEPQKVRIRIMLYTDTLPNMIRIQRVLTRCRVEATM